MFAAITMTASAATQTVVTYQKNCSLAVYPYNPDAPRDTFGNARVSNINELDDATCASHLPYPTGFPRSYQPQPPLPAENPVKPGSENLRVPYAWHAHAYYNDSNHLSGSGITYYESFLDRFEITIQPDAFENTTIADVQCTSMPMPRGYDSFHALDLLDCDGVANDLYGGTRVTKEVIPQTKNVKIKWAFAVNDPHSGRPKISGNNGRPDFTLYYGDGSSSTFDSTQPENRKAEFAVTLHTKNNGSIWSATTTSRALIADLGIRKAHYPQNAQSGCVNNDIDNAASGWCYLTPAAGAQIEPNVVTPSDPEGRNRYFFWHNVGSVASVWKKPPPPPPVSRCDSIDVSPTPNIFNVGPGVTELRVIDVNKTGNWVENFQWDYTNLGRGALLVDPNDSKHATLTNPERNTVVNVVSDTPNCQATWSGVEQPPPVSSCDSIEVSPTPNVFNVGPGVTELRVIDVNKTGNWVENFQWDYTNLGRGALLVDPNDSKHATLTNPERNTVVNVVSDTPNCQATWSGVGQPLVCNSITIEPLEFAAGTTTTVRITRIYPPNWPGTFSWTISGNNRNHLRASADTRSAVLTNPQANATVTIRANDPNAGNCVAQLRGRGQPPVCKSIVVTPSEFPIVSGSSSPHVNTPIDISVLPNKWPGIFNWSLNDPGANTVMEVEPNTRHAILRDPVAGTTVEIKSSDLLCQAILRGRDQPPPVCRNVTVFPTQFNVADSATTLQIMNVDADPGWIPNYNWSLVNPGATTQLAVEDNKLTAVLMNPTASTVVTLRSSDERCQAVIPGVENPPPPEVGQCRLLEISQDRILQGMPDQTPFVTRLDLDPGAFNGNITWTSFRHGQPFQTFVHPAQVGDRASFTNLDEDVERIVVEVNPAGPNANCRRVIYPEEAPPLPPPPLNPMGELSKRSFEVTSHGNVIRKGETAEFQITFTALSKVPEVVLRDSIQNKLIGNRGGEIEVVRGIYGGRDFRIEDTRMANPVPECGQVERANSWTCFEGTPFVNSGLRIRNLTTNQRIILIYQGKLVRSKINENYCKRLDPSFCGELFTNEITDTLGNRSRSTLYTPCPFLLTRGIGDVIMQQDMSVGSDISSCAKIPNIEGPTTTTPPEETPGSPSTGTSETLNIPPHTLCQQSNRGDASLPVGYRNPLKSMSSAICEVAMTLNDMLTPPQIRKDVLANITRITRYNNNLGIGRNVTVSNLNEPPLATASPNSDFQIYKLKNGNLTIDAYTPPVTKGARTYVIENGDLIINGNIAYDETGYDLTSIKEIPVIAFIVINGNIKIAPGIEHLSGIFVSLKGEGIGARASGKIMSSSGNSDKTMRIDGTVYGDIEPLFASRSYVGNARLGQGTIVINYDGRLFYNMPPGLKEVLEIAPEQVAR